MSLVVKPFKNLEESRPESLRTDRLGIGVRTAEEREDEEGNAGEISMVLSVEVVD